MTIVYAQERAAAIAREQRIASAALAGFGFAPAPLRLLKRTSTTLFHVAAPEPLVLRLHPPERHPRPVVWSELEWLRALGRDSALLVPEPLPATDGSLLLDIVDGDETRYCALFRWLPGRRRRCSLSSDVAERLGETVALLHQQGQRWQPPDGFECWDFDWHDIATVEAIIGANGAGLVGTAQLETIRNAVALVNETMQSLGQGPDAYGLIHGDTNLTNFLFGRRVAILDFEVCCYGHFLFDVTRTLRELGACPRGAELTSAFHHGYAAARPLPPLDSPLMRAFTAMNIVDVVVWLLGLPELRWSAATRRRLVAELAELAALMAEGGRATIGSGDG